ncbi:hypothetical protein [Methanosarcina horonobensis]|uniref:hypothetical protein n=1 Tax=Methanosarcina horonobensis TaxID=418008 RepID=UPI0022B909CB|nr:hypothetical protein [Methanosarcina horonobensis]
MTQITLNALSREAEDITSAYTAAGGDAAVLHNHELASLVISGNKVLSANGTEGIVLEKKETEHGVDIKMIIKKVIRSLFLSTSASGSSLKTDFRKSKWTS